MTVTPESDAGRPQEVNQPAALGLLSADEAERPGTAQH